MHQQLLFFHHAIFKRPGAQAPFKRGGSRISLGLVALTNMDPNALPEGAKRPATVDAQRPTPARKARGFNGRRVI